MPRAVGPVDSTTPGKRRSLQHVAHAHNLLATRASAPELDVGEVPRP